MKGRISTENEMQTMRRTGFRQMTRAEKVSRVALQVSSGQKVTVQDLVDCETLLNLHHPGTVSPDKARKRIYERNSRLMKPQGTYLNYWDNLGVKCKKHCQILLPQKVIDTQERSYSEKLRNEPKIKVILKAMVNNMGKSSLFPVIADSTENSKSCLRSKSLLNQSARQNKNPGKGAAYTESATVVDEEASLNLDRSDIGIRDQFKQSAKFDTKTSLIKPRDIQMKSVRSNQNSKVVFADFGNDSIEASFRRKDSIEESVRGKFRSEEPLRGSTEKSENGGFNLPLLKSMMIGKLEPLNEINFRTSHYLKYVNHNSPLMRERFKQVLSSRKGVSFDDSSKDKVKSLDKKVLGPVIEPNLLIPQKSKYKKPEIDLNEGEFEETSININTDIMKVEGKVNDYDHFYYASHCLYPSNLPALPDPNQGQIFSLRSTHADKFWPTKKSRDTWYSNQQYQSVSLT